MSEQRISESAAAYFRRRADRQAQAAAEAADEHTRSIHRQLVELYRSRAESSPASPA